MKSTAREARPSLAVGERALNSVNPDPAGLRCHIVDAARGIMDITISDGRARVIYLLDDHEGMYVIKDFERSNPRVIRIDLFHDLAGRWADSRDEDRVRMIYRPGEYRILSAENIEGEVSLIDWLGQCSFVVK